MTGDLWALAAALLLATLQLTLSSVLTLRQLGGTWVAGPVTNRARLQVLAGALFVRTVTC